MKITIRILMYVHLVLIAYGLYCIGVHEEFVNSSKFIFIGMSGILIFLSASMIFPTHTKFETFILIFGLVLYSFVVFGFFNPYLLREYWQVMLGSGLFLILNTLYVSRNKRMFESKMDYLFVAATIICALPFLTGILTYTLYLISFSILSLLTLILLYRLLKIS